MLVAINLRSLSPIISSHVFFPFPVLLLTSSLGVFQCSFTVVILVSILIISNNKVTGYGP